MVKNLKKNVDTGEDKPDLICAQETWLRPCLDFVVPGYDCLRKDRKEGTGGGCAIFVRAGVQYQQVVLTTTLECMAVRVWGEQGRMNIVNFYNPCLQLRADELEKVTEEVGTPVIWVGDFNAHNPLWGSRDRDRNGEVIEELMDKQGLVCLNDGRPTRFDIRTGRVSCIDLTIASPELAWKGKWETWEENAMGSDHFPIVVRFGQPLLVEEDTRPRPLNYNKAKWAEFAEGCLEGIDSVEEDGTIDEWNDSLCSMLRDNVNRFIPRKKAVKRKAVPWWNKMCDEAVRERNKAYSVLRKYPVQENAIEYKRLRAKARRVIKTAKRECWRNYCGRLGEDTTLGEVWAVIRRMAGVVKGRSIPVLEEGGVVATNDSQKASMCVKKFQEVHSGVNIGEEGIVIRNEVIRNQMYKLEVNQDNSDPSNVNFSMEELRRAIQRGRKTAPGKDGLGYEIFKKLDDMVLYEILALINVVWDEGVIPVAWRHAVVVPILKPGKEAAKPGSYRPIALTAVLCKIMERMVTDRLTYKLEKQGWLTPIQSGFRLGRGTMDSVLALDLDIRKAMANKEAVVAVFLDIEKAYDMLWKDGLGVKLFNAGIRGRMLNWIRAFLQNRTIQVRVGGAYSETVGIDNGTPQGSVISPVLFNLMINDMFEEVGAGFGLSLFADDGAIWKRGRNIKFSTGKIQGALDKVVAWAEKWGFKISVEKSKFVIFTNKRKTENLGLNIYGKPLERVKEFKFLGVIFEEKVTWKKHIEKIVRKCEKVINVMRCLAGSTWGANRDTQIMVYRAMIRSALDYGCLAYGAAAKTNLAALDRVQAKALRVCSGAFCTTPIPALLVEMGEIPLGLRRRKLALHYIAKLYGHDQAHPGKQLLEECWELGGGETRCFVHKIKAEEEELGLSGVRRGTAVVWPSVPPWLLPNVEVDWTISERKREKGRGEPDELVRERMQQEWADHVQMYTDGSMDPNSKRVGFAVHIPSLQITQSRRLPNGVSVFTSEMVALIWAVNWVEEVRPQQAIICSDSAAALMALQGGRSQVRPDLVCELLTALYRINQTGIRVEFMWVPAHVGVEGNEAADVAAKEALSREEVDVGIALGISEYRSMIKEELTRRWQSEWEGETRGRFYYNIQNSVRGGNSTLGNNRREQVIMTRLRFGHCGLAGGLARIGKHGNGLCECGTEETVQHVFMECPIYTTERRELFAALLDAGLPCISLRNILNPEEHQSAVIKAVMDYLWNTGLHHKV